MKIFIIKLFLFTLVLCGFACMPHKSFAQKTKIMGTVINAETQEPIPFVNVYIRGTTTGVRTDFNGQYALEFNFKADSLIASYIGFVTVIKPIELNKFQTLDFQLFPSKYNLDEVVIKPTENPAEVLLNKIIENKDKNNSDNLDAYQYESYNKIEVDANNVSEKFQNKAVLKPFKFVFSNIDTSIINGKSYLPILLSETMSDMYYRGTPKARREIIEASRVSGIENISVAQFLGDMYQTINVYDNYISLFQKFFVSPIANFGLGYYRYYLVDSARMGNKWCYKIMFKPRRKQELTFTGNFWVADTSFAIKQIDMRIASDANVDFMNDLVSRQEFDKVDSSHWMMTNEKLIVDFNIIKKTKTTIGFFGTKTTSYRNFVINQLKDNSFYNTPTNIAVDNSSLKKDNQYWASVRHDSLSKDEKAVYKMVDSLKSIPLFNSYVNIIKTLALGYYIWKDFEFGPYFSVFSTNSLEGMRFRVGGRTSNAFSTKIMLDAHLAYGTKDETFKYGGGFIYMLNKNPRKNFTGSYYNDIEQLGASQNSFQTDNILASLLRRDPNNKLSMVQQFKGACEYEWFSGFSNIISFVHRQLSPIGGLTFNFNNGDEAKPNIITSEVCFDTHFAYHEKFIFGEFERMSTGAKWPILNLKYAMGIKDFLGGDYGYHRIQLGATHWFNIGSFGWSHYNIELGRIWGTFLPYPLLKLHEGNETRVYDDYAFNLMNYYEFASDRYFSFNYTHHFDGFFFNKVPLFRKLKWREVASIKGCVGSLDNKSYLYNKPSPDQPPPFYTLSYKKPYLETSVGVENILKVLNVNAVWRLTYLNDVDPNTNKKVPWFGILATLKINF